ncbi:uncharacterized protein BO66DRAFT_100621 [Aspergillus aculeatinus CBS 121060]|uniref:Uncharacterized protein n=1 Tax=Aspergillus aculeatinus CBS 121060 TaxID=1448322 RepID=A0ACD1H807_9EURO|nr:hypothetical protein BO66DRAFT_100621 [Aspergillus aculeatinus CBS 121060]RAH69697.1 hypothetical protein BO66DRAFT_100621 [Aspergillus aculeatinus CBS 121060]
MSASCMLLATRLDLVHGSIIHHHHHHPPPPPHLLYTSHQTRSSEEVRLFELFMIPLYFNDSIHYLRQTDTCTNLCCLTTQCDPK